MITVLQRLAGNTIELTMTLPWNTIKSTYDKIYTQLLDQVEVAGFRRGKAPKELAAKQINPSKIYEEVIKEVLPKAYSDAIAEHKLQPIMHPNVEVLEAEENKDWKVKATTCEKPTITLGKYREAVSKLKANKTAKIVLPGQDVNKDKNNEEPTVGEVLDAIASEIKVDLPAMMLDQEVNRMLSNLVSETQKLGLTIEQYLQAQGKTSESIRKEYEEQARKTLSLEFALDDIADLEKISVDESDIEAVIKSAKSEEEKKSLAERKYYITSLLRRQKTIGKLLESPILKI